MHEHNHHHEDDHGHHHHNHSENPEGSGSYKPRKIDFVDFKMERAFAFDPEEGEEGIITYTIDEPARISIKVLKNGTRELYLQTILNFEERKAGTHTEKWDGRDYDGNIIDLPNAYMVIEGEPMSTYKPGEYTLEGMSDEEIVHGHPYGHSHNKYADDANIVPTLRITSIKNGDVLQDVVTIESELTGAKGYGDQAGFGVRYYLDNTLVEEEFYDNKCNGFFTYNLDTTSYADGEYTLYVGMCDHHQHATSRGYKVKIDNNVLSSADD
ncbi:MAG: hypothetical protein ABIJ59_13210 [Pseudomonadota bacterium]